MGVVYKAEDMNLKRVVALKFLASRALGTEDERTRFMNEARAAASLNHPNICTIHEIAEADGQSFIVMEYLEGEALESRIKKGKLSTGDTLEIASQIAEGLREAHRHGIVHRDIKPANIMITASGRVKIMDFGLASAPGGSKLTKEGTTLGTVAYMSPEQTHGSPVDHRADIWAFGVILYQMLCGELPFRGDYDQAIIYSILNENPRPLSEYGVKMPAGLEAIVDKALKKDPEERYQEFGALINDLGSGKNPVDMGVKSSGRRAGFFNPTRRFIRGALMVVFAAVFVIVKFCPRDGGSSIESIAVLPLENLSGDPDQEYISDGMTESLITELSQISSLRIISRTSVMQYKDSEKSLPQIARELGVDAVIEGSAILVGDKIRITTQLIDAKTDRHLWARDFDREFRDVLSLQKEVAISVARQVRAVLTPEEEAVLATAETVDPEIQKLYLRGRYHIGRLTVKDQRRGIELMKQTIDRSPDYGLAYVGIAEAYNNLIVLDGLSSTEGWQESKKWAERALEIDDSLGEAYLMIADVKALYEWDWVEAEEYYRRCLELSPGSVTGLLWYGNYLIFLGRDEEAQKLIELGDRLGPNDPGVLLNLAGVYDRLGMNEKAEKECREAIDLFPEFVHSYYLLSEICLKQSRLDEALSVLHEGIALSPAPLDSFRLAIFYARTGEDEKAGELLEDMLELPEDEMLRGYLSMTYLQFGNLDSAFVWLEKAYENRDQFLVQIYAGENWAALRDDPRYSDLCRRIGFPGCVN